MKEGKYVFYLIHFLSDQLMEFLAKNDDARRPPSVHAIHISRLKDRFTVFSRAKKAKLYNSSQASHSSTCTLHCEKGGCSLPDISKI